MSIQRYVEQLIEEIDEKMKIPYPEGIRDPENKSFFPETEEIDETMEYHSIPVTRFSKLLKESLPPPEKLNLKQTGMLVKKISGLLENWNYHLEYPQSTPVKEKYRLIYDHWEEFGIPTSGWHFHQDFCTGDCYDCPVKDYCETYKEWQENPRDFEMSDELDELHPESFSDDGSDRKTGKIIKPKKEKIKDILNSIPEKNFIPYMHNYCDRWCDKCTLRSSCSNFYFEKELLKLAANDDSDRSSFESVKHVFSLTSDILGEALNEYRMNIDLPVTTNDDFFPKLPACEQNVLNFAKEYVFSTSEWFNALPEEKITENHELLEPVNVIMYYHILISTKLARAFFGRVSYPIADPIQNDSNGSAKVALLAISKSLDSWTNLLNYKKDGEEVIIQQCVKLKKLEKMVERSFPNAQDFMRPGFDFLEE